MLTKLHVQFFLQTNLVDGVKQSPVQVGESNSHVPSVQTEHVRGPLLQLRVVCERILIQESDCGEY